MARNDYTIAGTSKLNGETFFRFATGSIKRRVLVLTRNKHTNIELRTLPQPMDIKSATAWLRAQGVDALMPTGHRNTVNKSKKLPQNTAAQHDAHVATWEQGKLKAAAFVARMAAARAAKRAAQAA